MHELLCQLINFYIVAFIVRIVLSWFPSGSGVLATVTRFLSTITDPVIMPIRRIMPATGALDLSPLVALLLLQIVVRGLIFKC
jgi:YggT family protein